MLKSKNPFVKSVGTNALLIQKLLTKKYLHHETYYYFK